MEDNLARNSEEKLFSTISALINESHGKIAKAVNTAMVYTYYGVGQYIVEYEQQGNLKGAYGKEVLQRLSERLTAQHGAGWSYSNLRQIRQFYLVYSNLTITDYQIQINTDTPQPKVPNFTLTWTHYLVLMRIENPDERKFYEIEAASQMWSVRQLQRQVASSLYERLALSSDKEKVLRLSREGQIIEKPTDIIKNPLVLEFVGLQPDAALSESKLETAILSKLQQFLLECGKGFLFESRQKRFTFDEENFYVDLVLYNRLLQCYVLVDLKVDKLTHQDLGQMQMYVNYYDRYVKQEFEKPTIGILLCKTKHDALVELTLPQDANIYAQQYALCLPDKKLLQEKLQEWVQEFKEYKEEEKAGNDLKEMREE
jgi:predicted nuclease of restriction endonuclease-like (RecB) superfamily